MNFNIIITDELGFNYNLKFDNYNSVLKEIKKWLKANDLGETPIYIIKIEILE